MWCLSVCVALCGKNGYKNRETSYLPRRGCGLSPEDSEREKILNRESMDDEGFDLPTIDNTDTLEHWLYPLFSIPTSAYEHWNTGFILYCPPPSHTNTGTLALSFTLHHIRIRNAHITCKKPNHKRKCSQQLEDKMQY